MAATRHRCSHPEHFHVTSEEAAQCQVRLDAAVLAGFNAMPRDQQAETVRLGQAVVFDRERQKALRKSLRQRAGTALWGLLFVGIFVAFFVLPPMVTGGVR